MQLDLSLGEEEVLLRLTDQAAEIAAWAAPGDPWERSRIEGLLEEIRGADVPRED